MLSINQFDIRFEVGVQHEAGTIKSPERIVGIRLSCCRINNVLASGTKLSLRLCKSFFLRLPLEKTIINETLDLPAFASIAIARV